MISLTANNYGICYNDFTYCSEQKALQNEEERMKKVALVIALVVLFAAVSRAAVLTEDREFMAGLKAYNAKNYTAAVKHFREYANKKPDPTAYYLLGYALYKQGKFTEADEYFGQAFLIDPEFSLEKVGLIKNVPEEITGKGLPLPSAESKPVEPSLGVLQPSMPEQAAVDEQRSKGPGQAPGKAPKPDAAGQKFSPPQEPAVPAPAIPHLPVPKRQMPSGAGDAALISILAAFGMVSFIIAIALYAFCCFCMYLIAKKVSVPAPWTAWIPIVQIWTFVMSAGKPAWWIILLFVPVVNIFVGIYLWMCITENLGKNKWLGLLVLVPLVGFFYPAWLAFSRTESPKEYSGAMS